MKTEAPAGEAQLSKYVDAERSHTESVAGLLLRIPGKDRVEIKQHAEITGGQYSACIQAATKSCDLDQDTRWLVEDYCRTLCFLDRLDTALIAQGNGLLSKLGATPKDSPASLWHQDHWRWMRQRVVRGGPRSSGCKQCFTRLGRRGAAGKSCRIGPATRRLPCRWMANR